MQTGWLSPTGEWHPCETYEHTNYASRVLNSSESRLENTSWVKNYSICNGYQRTKNLLGFASYANSKSKHIFFDLILKKMIFQCVN